MPGVPFDDKNGIIPNEKGRVQSAPKDSQSVVGDYVVGWIKRGPSGVIGTNKPDSVETVEMLMEDYRAGKLLNPPEPRRETIEQLLEARGIRYVTFADWHILDMIEQERGEYREAPRRKFHRVEDMLKAIAEHKALALAEPAPGD